MKLLYSPLFVSALLLSACSASSEDPALVEGPASAEGASFSTGPAEETNAGLIDCGDGSRISAVGTITAEDGTSWTVPASTQFETAPKAADLYNECGGQTLANIEALDLSTVPVMDAGGEEEFTYFIFADNYFELYVNGRLLAVDPVPFTPFNSNVVRFKAARPLTIAFMAVDWEENLGIGSEANRSSSYFPGDAGLVAHLQDASGDTVALTDGSWKAQTFYTAPLNGPACLTTQGNVRDSSACAASASSDGTQMSAAFWPIPEGWMNPDFDASAWPDAVTYTNDTVGVDNKNAYTNFTSVFDTQGADAEFIWSSNLVLDNLVLMRKTIP